MSYIVHDFGGGVRLTNLSWTLMTCLF